MSSSFSPDITQKICIQNTTSSDWKHTKADFDKARVTMFLFKRPNSELLAGHGDNVHRSFGEEGEEKPKGMDPEQLLYRKHRYIASTSDRI